MSSVSFDEVSRARILASIVDTKLDSMSNLKVALLAMSNRVGGVPALWDFYRFESVDPVLLATRKAHYPALVQSLLREDSHLSDTGNRALALLSHEVLAAKRAHECVLLELLLKRAPTHVQAIAQEFAMRGLPSDSLNVRSAIDTLCLRGYSQADENHYKAAIAEQSEDSVQLTTSFVNELAQSPSLAMATDDLLKTVST